MNRCRMTIRILVTLLAVLAFCVSYSIAAKEDPKLTIQKVGGTTPNPNWDAKAQDQGDLSHDPIIPKDEDIPNPNASEVTQGSEAGMAIGDDCTNPISITLPAMVPYTDTNHTCGRLNDYSNTCLGSYDGGEDIIYKVDVTANCLVNIKLDPKGTTYTGILVRQGTCPTDTFGCIARATGYSGTTAKVLSNVSLLAGEVYYIMIDTWPSPNCIPSGTNPSFQLDIYYPPPPPPNDSCQNAIAIGDVTGLAFDCTAATMDGPGGFITNRNIWYCYTATCNGMATASLCASTYDTRIRIWDGCTCPPTVTVAQDDDACNGPGSGLASEVSWEAIAGHQYLIEVAPYLATTTVGNGFLTTSCVVPPNGAMCSNALPVTINPGVFPLTLAGQTNCGYFNMYSSTCLGSYDGGEDIIYRLDVTQPVYMSVTMDPKTSTYTGWLIDDACPPDPTTCLYKKTSSSAVIYTQNGVSLAAGTYWLMVDTYPSPTCIPNFDITFDVSPGPPPNDTCSKATAIGDVFNLKYATDQATADGATTYITGPDIWYCYTAWCTGTVTANICNSGYDTRIQVFDGCTCPPTALIVQDDDACVSPNGLGSLVSFPSVMGHQYLIQVGGYSSAVGTGYLTVFCTPPPWNDDCDVVTPVPLTAGTPLTFTGNNVGATSDCPILGDPEVWHAFTIDQCMDVVVDYCTTYPVFGNVYIVVTKGCPCASYVLGTWEDVSCGDGNVTITYGGLAAGTYYIPVLLDPGYGAAGPYTIHVNGAIPTAVCAAGANTCDEYIGNVQVGTINNSSGCGTGGYTDYTSLSTDMVMGVGYPITVVNGYPYSSDQCGMWVDWNNDFCFGAGEQMTVSGTPGGGPYTATINAPCTVPAGPKLLRIRITYTGSVNPCGNTTYGEVEDYTINLVNHPELPPMSTVTPNPQYVYYKYAIVTVIDSFFVGQFAGGYDAYDVNAATVTVDGVTPTGVTILPTYPGFFCDVLCVTMPVATYLNPWGALLGTTEHVYTVAWNYSDATAASVTGDVTLIGKNPINPMEYLVPPFMVVLPGDFNLSGEVDISDPVAMISFIFAGGSGPENLMIGDCDCSRAVDISDVVYMIQYIFSGGPAPCTAS